MNDSQKKEGKGGERRKIRREIQKEGKEKIKPLKVKREKKIRKKENIISLVISITLNMQQALEQGRQRTGFLSPVHVLKLPIGEYLGGGEGRF